MSEVATEMEQKILEAAKKIFFRSGLKGARMQEIADEAGINRALLNYYFRTKDKLYKKVVLEMMKEMAPVFENKLVTTLTLQQFVEVMVTFLIDMNLTNPSFHLFYVMTLNENPEMFLQYLKKTATDHDPMDALIEKIEAAIEAGEIRSVNPEHLIWSIISMCSYPFMMQPLIKSYQGKSELEMNAFFVRQKKEIIDLVWMGIKK